MSQTLYILKNTRLFKFCILRNFTNENQFKDKSRLFYLTFEIDTNFVMTVTNVLSTRLINYHTIKNILPLSRLTRNRCVSITCNRWKWCSMQFKHSKRSSIIIDYQTRGCHSTVVKACVCNVFGFHAHQGNFFLTIFISSLW